QREFRGQEMVVRMNFGPRLRDGAFEPPHGQAHRAVVNERGHGYPDKGGKQKTGPGIHDCFDHLSKTLSLNQFVAMLRMCSYLGETRERMRARSGEQHEDGFAPKICGLLPAKRDVC